MAAEGVTTMTTRAEGEFPLPRPPHHTPLTYGGYDPQRFNEDAFVRALSCYLSTSPTS